MTTNQRKSLQHAGFTFQKMTFQEFQAHFDAENPETAYWDQDMLGAWIAPKRNVLGTLAVIGGIAALAVFALSFLPERPIDGNI